jgi:hypothetical protein
MPTMDVPAREWSDFLESFSLRHRAWLATIEDAGGRIDHGAKPMPLAAVTPEREGPRVRAIEISLRLRQTDAGADRALEIVDGAGHCTRIAFRAAAVPEMVDGVAPGEV